MKKIKKFTVFQFMILAGLLMSFGNISNAQEIDTEVIQEDNDIIEEEAVILATVNAYDAKAYKADEHEYTVVFNLFNRVGSQPDIRYKVNLVRQVNGEGRYVVYSNLFKDVDTLGENDSKIKSLNFNIPKYISGDYYLELEIRNTAGLILALVDLEDVILIGQGEYIEIKSETCSVVVGNESNKYDVSSGVDVASNEELKVICNIKNNSNKEVTLQSNFETYFRTVFGELLDNKVGESVVLLPNQEKLATFILPIQEAPQAYDVKLTLKNKEMVSNPLIIHYVTRGASATIQNLIFDKNSYVKGETAKAQFIWTSSADSFPEARSLRGTQIEGTRVRIIVRDENGNECANFFYDQLKNDNISENLEIPMEADCNNLMAEVVLTDANGNIYDRSDYAYSKVEAKEILSVEDKGGNIVFSVLFVLFVVLVALGAFMALKKKRMKVFFFMFFLLGTLFFMSDYAKADTISMGVRGCKDSDCYTWTLSGTVSLNKQTYAKSETIIGSGSLQSISCSNISSLNRKLKFKLRSGSNNVTNFVEIYDRDGSRNNNVSGSKTISAPSYAGDFNARFRHHIDFHHRYFGDVSNSKEFSVYFSVKRSCTGGVPANANLCSGDDSGLTSDTPRTLKSSCGVPKCEYTCKSGYVNDGGVCRLFMCTGGVPANANLCSGDDSGLTSDTPRTLKSSCGVPKCEYTCNAPYIVEEGICQLPNCSCNNSSNHCTPLNPKLAKCNVGVVKNIIGGGNDNLKWSCVSGGGMSQCKNPSNDCFALKKLAPQCVFADESSCSEPQPDCINGTPSNVNLINGIKWSWTCSNCNATITCDEVKKKCPFIEVQP